MKIVANKKRKKNKGNQQKTITIMIDINSTISIIPLNNNGLNIPI